MNEEKDPKPDGHEQDLSEFAKHVPPKLEGSDGPSASRVILRGCGIVAGVVLLTFFFIVGTCFIR